MRNLRFNAPDPYTDPANRFKVVAGEVVAFSDAEANSILAEQPDKWTDETNVTQPVTQQNVTEPVQTPVSEEAAAANGDSGQSGGSLPTDNGGSGSV